MRWWSTLRLGWVGAVVFVLAPGCGLAQQAIVSGGQSGMETDTIRTQANLVLVDVVVTKDGKPVHGLTKDKFHVLDSGVAQAVTVFEEHQPAAPGSVPKPPGRGPNTYSNAPEYPQGSAVNVLLLDVLNTRIDDQGRMRQQVIEYLKSVPAGTPFAVFTLAGDARLRMLVGVTTDSGRAEKALQGALNLVQYSKEFNPMLDMHPEDVPQHMHEVLAAERNRVSSTATQDLARYLARIPGRKNLIWFCGVVPSIPTAILSATRVAVYPVDVHGFVAAGAADASPLSRQKGMADPSASEEVAQGILASYDTVLPKRDALKRIAQETGGEAFVEANDIKGAVTRIVEEGSNFYTIGYEPKSYDGTYHGLKVTVDGKNQAAYRQSYLSPKVANATVSPEASAKRAMTAALEPGAPPVSDILFKVRVQAVEGAAGVPAATASLKPVTRATAKADAAKMPVRRYTVDYSVPASALSLTVGRDGVRHGRVELAVVAYSAEGKPFKAVDQDAPFELKPEMYERALQHGIDMHQEIALPAGQSLLRVIVHDLNSERLGAIEIPVNVK